MNVAEGCVLLPCRVTIKKKKKEREEKKGRKKRKIKTAEHKMLVRNLIFLFPG